jgi:oligosaccharide repeat unit polymerase
VNPDLVGDLLPALALTGLAAGLRLYRNSFLEPGVFFASVWCGFVWLALICAFDVDVWPPAVWWILASAAAVAVGSHLGARLAKRDAVIRSPAPGYSFRGVEGVQALAVGVGFLSVLILLFSRGKGIDIFLSVNALAATAREYSVARYLQGWQEPLAARVLYTGIYLGALLGGLLLATATSRRRRLLAILPLVPALAVALVLTTKAVILYTLLALLASYLSFFVTGRAQALRLSGRRAGLGAAVVVSLAGLAVLIQMFRYGFSSPARVPEVVNRLRLYAFGYLGAFSNWLSHMKFLGSHLSYGKTTFAGVFELLGGGQRKAGVYTDSVQLWPAHISSNVYTVFRGLITDFGGPGALIFLVVVGIVAGYAFVRVQQTNLVYTCVLSAFYAATMLGMIVNVFVYNSMLLAWLLFAAYLVLSRGHLPAALADLAASRLRLFRRLMAL